MFIFKFVLMLSSLNTVIIFGEVVFCKPEIAILGQKVYLHCAIRIVGIYLLKVGWTILVIEGRLVLLRELIGTAYLSSFILAWLVSWRICWQFSVCFAVLVVLVFILIYFFFVRSSNFLIFILLSLFLWASVPF